MEGPVGIRVAGQTDWKHLWMVITAGSHFHDFTPPPSAGARSDSPSVQKRNRISSLWSRGQSPTRNVLPLPAKATIQLFASNKAKDRKKPVLTFQNVTQAFAVYPERPELISRSTLMKVEGTFGDGELAGPMRESEGWMLLMPEVEGKTTTPRASEMLKWLLGEWMWPC